MTHSTLILILYHNVGIKRAEDSFNMGIFFLPKLSFIMGTFSDPQHTHPRISYWSHPPGAMPHLKWDATHLVKV